MFSKLATKKKKKLEYNLSIKNIHFKKSLTKHTPILLRTLSSLRRRALSV